MDPEQRARNTTDDRPLTLAVVTGDLGMFDDRALVEVWGFDYKVNEYKVGLRIPGVIGTFGKDVERKPEKLEFETGAEVFIHSLRTAPQYNLKTAVVESYSPDSDGLIRCKVKITSGGAMNRTLFIKETNVQERSDAYRRAVLKLLF